MQTYEMLNHLFISISVTNLNFKIIPIMKILPFHKHIMRILEKFKSATYLSMRMPKALSLLL